MKKKQGFTLIEVLIATAIMIVVMGGIVYGLSQCANLTETVHNQDIALNAIQEKMEEIANSDLSQIMNAYGGHTFEVDSLNPIPGEEDAQGQVQVAEISANQLYDVTVTVSWEQRGGRQLSRSITTTYVRKLEE